ncbi:hypothetical protein QJS66_15560 [Kocuria rhizophila]|nr:hypothetical protein QJS66_15560 [Kocuria rhizophila]
MWRLREQVCGAVPRSAHASEAIATAYRTTLGHSRLSAAARAGAGPTTSSRWRRPPSHHPRPGQLINRGDLDRLRQCEDATCGWVCLTRPGGTGAGASPSDCGRPEPLPCLLRAAAGEQGRRAAQARDRNS